MRKFLLLLLAGCCAFPALGANIDLKESKFTQVVNDVQIISTSDNAKHAATVDAIFKMPDVLRTGPASRAELVAEDHTITRVGANTIFSFDPASRSIDLKQGSLLFNSPKGKGGGSIHTAAATAAVLGTTIIVVTTPDGGFKVLTLEGKAEVRFLNGLRRHIAAGQLIFVLPGSAPGPVLSFRLDRQVAGSKLVSGFATPLPSIGLISSQVTQQIHQMEIGHAADTGLYIGDLATVTTVQIINPLHNFSPVQPIKALPPEVLNQTDPFGDITSNPGGGGGGGTTNPVVTIPRAPAGTVVPTSDGGFLTPDGYVFNSSSSPAGPTFAQGVAEATLLDVSINSPMLDQNHVFVGQVDVTFPIATGFSGTAYGTFAARNIDINTSSIDFSQFMGVEPQNFIFFASQNMTIENDLVLTAFATPELIFFAGNMLNINPGVTISAETPNLEFGSSATLNLSGVTLVNTGLDLSLVSFSSIVLDGLHLSDTNPDDASGIQISNESNRGNSSGNVSLNNTTANADEIFISSTGFVSATGVTPAAGTLTSTIGVTIDAQTGMTVGVDLNADIETGGIFLTSESGLITVNNNAQLTASDIFISSGGSALVDSIAAPKAQFMSVSGGNVVGSVATMQGTVSNPLNLGNLSSLAVSAYTVVMQDVNMTGNVVLSSFNGVLAPNPNTSASIVPGDVNFFRNVNYNGQAAQNFVNNGGGITVTTLSNP